MFCCLPRKWSFGGLLQVGSVSVDGTKIKANASKAKSLRSDRLQALRKTLAGDISDLMARAEAADQSDSDDGLSLPEEISRRDLTSEAGCGGQSLS